MNIIAVSILGIISSGIAMIAAILCIIGSRILNGAVLITGAVFGFVIAGLYAVSVILILLWSAKFEAYFGIVIIVVII